jgi:hypothetical protein
MVFRSYKVKRKERGEDREKKGERNSGKGKRIKADDLGHVPIVGSS